MNYAEYKEMVFAMECELAPCSCSLRTIMDDLYYLVYGQSSYGHDISYEQNETLWNLLASLVKAGDIEVSGTGEYIIFGEKQ
jgi:hypothetical protein